MLEFYEKPQKLNPNNVVYWDESLGKLSVGKGKARIVKAQKFCNLGLVEERENGWIIKPIKGYNKTLHKVSINLKECSCQFNQTTGKECSHILAVKIFKRIDSYNQGINQDVEFYNPKEKEDE
jgi:hypothetical protein